MKHGGATEGEVPILSFDLTQSTSFDQATDVQEVEDNVWDIDNSNTVRSITTRLTAPGLHLKGNK